MAKGFRSWQRSTLHMQLSWNSSTFYVLLLVLVNTTLDVDENTAHLSHRMPFHLPERGPVIYPSTRHTTIEETAGSQVRYELDSATRSAFLAQSRRKITRCLQTGLNTVTRMPRSTYPSQRGSQLALFRDRNLEEPPDGFATGSDRGHTRDRSTKPVVVRSSRACSRKGQS